MTNKFYIHETSNGYIYDRRIFWGIIAIVLVLIFFVAKEYDFNFKTTFYFNCKEVRCKNPLINPELRAYNTYTGQDYKKDCVEAWCTEEYLSRGEYGIKPPDSFIYNSLGLISFLLVGLGLLLNHRIHNKGKEFGIKLNLPEKWLKKLRKLGKKLENLEDDLEEE